MKSKKKSMRGILSISKIWIIEFQFSANRSALSGLIRLSFVGHFVGMKSIIKTNILITNNN